jgi:NTP pyrophosphatase (non-canonical NTP hydrolase)
MSLEELSQIALEIRTKYDQLTDKQGYVRWGLSQYTEGFVGDVGDLMKLIQVKEGYRALKDTSSDVDTQLIHELSDCLWSLLVISGKLNIDLEAAFLQSMQTLKTRIERKLEDSGSLS